MKIYIDTLHDPALYRAMCIFALLLFFAAVVISALLFRQKRYRWLWLALPMLCLSYFMEQCFDMAVMGYTYSQTAARIVSGFASLPNLLLLTVCFAAVVAEVLLMRNIHLHEKNRITPMSVKEATDSLLAGILCYAPGARVLLVNRVMQDFCRRTIGTELTDEAGPNCGEIGFVEESQPAEGRKKELLSGDERSA